MLINELKEAIHKKISGLTEQIAQLSQPFNVMNKLAVLDAYSEVFTLLFGEPGKEESFIKLLKADPRNENVNSYLKLLSDLRKQIKSLPFDEAITGILLGKISEYCNFRQLSSFEHKGTLSRKEYKEVLSGLTHESLLDTVHIRTWGTKRELGNGFRNILLQQIHGEGVGHASVTMRFAADERGQELIKKYCQTKEGGKKIPYELKFYNGVAVYEVYWSYWPEGLQTLDNDIKTEQSSIEYQENIELLSTMPLELRSRYLFQKYTREWRVPIIGSLGETPHSLFPSNIPGSRKMALQADSIDASRDEPDLFVRNYLYLKVQQYKIDEEINTLELLRTNYLAEKKPFSEDSLADKVKIKPNSNFLILLNRFFSQLDDKRVAAHVLLSKEITREQSVALNSEIFKLIELKKMQDDALKLPIKRAAALIQENHADLISLCDQIEELNSIVNLYSGLLNDAAVVLGAAGNSIAAGETYNITDKEKKSFQAFIDLFTEQPATKKLIKKIIATGAIELAEASKLEKAFNDYKVYLETQLSKKNQDLVNKNNELHTVYLKNNKGKTDFLEERVMHCHKLLNLNESELIEFAVFKENTLIRLKTQQKIDQNNTANEAVEKVLAEFIAQDNHRPQKGKKKDIPVVPVFSGIEVTYEDTKGPRTISIRTFDEALKAKNDIAAAQEWLKKQHIAVTKDTVATADIVSEAPHKRKKQPAKLDDAGLMKFTYHNDSGTECTRTIKSSEDLDALHNSLRSCKASLETRVNEIFARLVRLKVARDISLDDLSQRFRRSSSNDARLRGFNIEKMLAKASEIASKEESFHLANENCSTTTMKLLHAGAPADVAAMFDWHKLEDGESVASNMLITNPQAVYSAGKLVERAGMGDSDAQAMIKAKRITKPDRFYNRLLNELARTMVTHNRVNLSLPGKSLNNSAAPREPSWYFYLQFLPYLFKLYRDIFHVVKLKEEENSNTLEAQVSRELKVLNGQEYYIIDSINPSLALNRLKESLKANKTHIPFFNTDTLSRIEQYIILLQSKEFKTEEENNTLQNYHALITERDERVKCVEDALLSGNSVAEYLEKRTVDTEKMAWIMTHQEKIEALVDNFIYTYQDIRNKNALSFLTANFLHKLDACNSIEMKFKLIKQQVEQYPQGRSAKALSVCLSQDTIFQSLSVPLTSAKIPSAKYPRLSKVRFYGIAPSPATPDLTEYLHKTHKVEK